MTYLEAATRRRWFRQRISAPGQHIASPIAVGDRLLVAAAQPGDDLDLLSGAAGLR